MNSNPQDFDALVMAIRLVMAKWATLNHAIENEWAGEDSMMMKRLMENDLLSNFQERWFATGKETEIYADEISEFLLGEMDETFNCSLEDGSDREIAELLLQFYTSSKMGDMSMVNQFIEKNQNLIPGVNRYLELTRDYLRFEREGVDYDDEQEEGEYGGDEMEEEEEEEEAPNTKNKKPQVDDDGWITY